MQGLELLVWCCMQKGIQYQPLIRGKSQQEIEELASNMMEKNKKKRKMPASFRKNEVITMDIKKSIIIFLYELQDSYQELKRWEQIPSLYKQEE